MNFLAVKRHGKRFLTLVIVFAVVAESLKSDAAVVTFPAFAALARPIAVLLKI